MFGGKPDNHSSILLGDTWEWDGSTWTLNGASGPSSRDNFGMAYDSGRSRTVLFGGLTSAGTSGDLWEYGVHSPGHLNDEGSAKFDLVPTNADSVRD